MIAPVADRLNEAGVPRFVIAAALMAITSGVRVMAVIALEPLLSTSARRLPEIRAEIEGWVESASGLLGGLEDLSEEIERTVGPQNTADEAPERAVSRYFAAVTLVSPGLGVAMAAVLSFVGLDNATLWGVAAGSMSFILYLRPLMIFFRF